MNWDKLKFSWETKIVSLAGVLYVAVQGFSEPNLQAAFHDGKLQLAVGMAVLAWLSKSTNAHGTEAAPIPPATAARIAEVVDKIDPPKHFVGAPIFDGADVFQALPDDPHEVGFTDVIAGRGTFVKKNSAVYKQTA